MTTMTDPRTPMTRCLIALGSNLGDRLENVRAGVAEIRRAAGIEIVAVSPLYETAPVGGPDDQGPYLNAALAVDTTLDAAELLAFLHRIEAGRERQRTVHWGPRTLDLDLLVHGDLVTDTTTLEVPHPRMHERRFVMVPVCDIAPEVVHPRLARTMRDLLAELPIEPGDLTRLVDLGLEDARLSAAEVGEIELDTTRPDSTELDTTGLDTSRFDDNWNTIPEHSQ